ncbi:MAG: peptide ABC transporter substrate-binding protein [Chloroflexi bacterium]|nr:peptide ABC transporter substrate-binding protein [Chloroflexota bacterium]MCK4262477.1 peptide ABC transporter substrate-binding protein [Dehalococcoidia bacterium]
MNRTRHVLLLPLLACILLLLPSAACQFTELSSSAGGVLNLWDTGPMTLDPAISSEMRSHTYVMQIFSGLVRLDEGLEVVPDIAESWERSEDGKSYTFSLRRGVKFHDGRELKAADFKYSWERACAPATGSQTAATYLGDIIGAEDVLAGGAGEISGVKVVDDYTLQVTVDAPKAYFLCKLTYPTAFVVDRANVESGEDWWYQPNGTGPFKMVEWRRGQLLVLERNQLYYGEPTGVDRVIFHLLAGAPMAMYETGEIDVVPVSGTYIDLVRDETSPFHRHLAITPELSLYYIGFDTTAAPFDDADVRRAFCHAVDKKRVVDLTFRGMVTAAEGILPPGMPGFDPGLEGLDYDVAKARDLIAASRYGDVSNLPPITITISGYGNNIPDYLGAVIQQWRQNLGVEVVVRQLEPENFLYNLKEERDQMFVCGWVADYPDPHNFLDNLFHTGSENNVVGYDDAGLDSLLDQASIEQDNDARLAMYRQAEQQLVNEAPCLPLCFGTSYVLVRPYVKGYELSPLGIPDLSRVYVERD